MHRIPCSPMGIISILIVALMPLAACGEDDAGSPDSSAPATVTSSTGAVAAPSTPDNEVESPTSTPDDPGPPQSPSESGREATPTLTPQAAEPTETPEAEDSAGNDEPLPEPENPAPELAQSDQWYNSAPLTLAELRGKPVLLVFWATY